MAAECDDQIVGMCTGQLLVSTAEGGSKVIVEDLVVAEKQRGHGIGSRLVDAVEKWGAGCGAKAPATIQSENCRQQYDSVGP